jgi:curved DNA-binding protein CbpA
MNPYLVLKVPPTADDKEIRRAYLEAVKTASPDRDPAGFQAACAAYEKIKDGCQRRNYFLFNKTPGGQTPLETVLSVSALLPPPEPLPLETLKQLLRSCAKP